MRNSDYLKIVAHVEKHGGQVNDLMALCLKGVPLERVLGEIDFLGLTLKLTKDVLIPRPETELLAERIVQAIDVCEGKVALDLCTGSGCIGLAVKKALPGLEMILSDISPMAADLSIENAKKNGLEVKVVVDHLFDGLEGKKIDYLFCNPPYIPAHEYANLDPSVKDHEPSIALLGGSDGLMFYRMIKNEAKKTLNPGAKCFFEIGYNQGESVKTIFSDRVWVNQRVYPDYAGHDRFFFLEFSP